MEKFKSYILVVLPQQKNTLNHTKIFIHSITAKLLNGFKLFLAPCTYVYRDAGTTDTAGASECSHCALCNIHKFLEYSAGAGYGCNGCTSFFNNLERTSAKSCDTNICYRLIDMKFLFDYIDLRMFDFNLHYKWQVPLCVPFLKIICLFAVRLDHLP